MTNLTINFNFPTRKNSIPFSSIPEGPFMGHFGGGATNNDMLQIKGRDYTYNIETNHTFFNGDYTDHVVYSYRPVMVTVEVDNMPPPPPPANPMTDLDWEEYHQWQEEQNDGCV